MQFCCKDSCGGTFFCIIRIRNKEIENTKQWQPFPKAFKFLYQYKLKGRGCDKHAAACIFWREAECWSVRVVLLVLHCHLECRALHCFVKGPPRPNSPPRSPPSPRSSSRCIYNKTGWGIASSLLMSCLLTL